MMEFLFAIVLVVAAVAAYRFRVQIKAWWNRKFPPAPPKL